MTTTSTPALRNDQGIYRKTDFLHPKVDIFETDVAVTLVAEIPGAGEDDTDITLERNVLTIRATRALPESPEFEPYYAESRASGFERVFIISEAIDREGIIATVKDGLLHLALPKTKQALSRKVAVTAR